MKILQDLITLVIKTIRLQQMETVSCHLISGHLMSTSLEQVHTVPILNILSLN